MSSTITNKIESKTNKEVESTNLVLLPFPSPTSPLTDTLLKFAAELADPATTIAANKSSSSPPHPTAGGPPSFLDHPPSPSVLPPPYASSNPFTKANKHSRPTPLGYVPPPTPLASRRKRSIVLSPLLPSNHSSNQPRARRSSSSHKFHATRPRQSSYTPTSQGSFSSFASPRSASFPPRTPGSPLAIFPPTPSHLQHGHNPRRPSSSSIMTLNSSTTPTITIFNEPTLPPSSSSSSSLPFTGAKFRRSESVSSEFALSLGVFETSLPASFLPQPSPPTSPNPSPITHSFPPLSHHPSSTTQPGGPTRTTRMSRSRPSSSNSLELRQTASAAPHTFGNAPPSPRKSIGRTTVPVSPGSAPSKAKQFLGVGSPMAGNEDKSWGGGQKRTLSASETLQARKDKERRKRAEAARPLPYSKKLEIDAFFGEVAHKPKKHSSSSRSGASSKFNASAGRNVGMGRGVEHIGEDGTLWMDVEEEQEWAWLLSEIGRGGQPLASWPIEFTSSNQPNGGVSPTTATFPTYHSSSGLATPFEHEEQHLLADDRSAWTILENDDAPKLVSVLDMPKKSKDLPIPMDEDSDSGSSSSSASRSANKKSQKEKKRPKPLKLASTLSSSLPKSFTLPTSTTPSTTPTTLPPASLGKPISSEEGKSEFLSSTFKPATPPSPSYTINSTTETEGNRPRTSSSASKKSVAGGTPKVGGGRGSLGGATSLVKGFFSRGNSTKA